MEPPIVPSAGAILVRLAYDALEVVDSVGGSACNSGATGPLFHVIDPIYIRCKDSE
jgi:hypothetical protein